MANKKKNHYVPKFYLRNFTDDPQNEKSKIDLFNIKGNTYVGPVYYGPQMQESYFYSIESGWEDRLNDDFEGNHKQIISDLLAGKTPSKNVLMEVVLLMHFRTKVRRNKDIIFRKILIDRNLDYLVKSFKSHIRNSYFGLGRIVLFFLSEKQIESLVRRESYREYLKPQDIAGKNIDNFKRLKEEAKGLEAVILENDTKNNLISSDHPAIIINPFLSKRVKNAGVNGLKQMGVLLLLPISPKYLLLCYDPEIYELDPKKILTSQDVSGLNALQVWVAEEAVYSRFLSKQVLYLIKQNLKKRKSPQMVISEIGSEYEMYYEDDNLPDSSFSFLSLKKNVNQIRLRMPFARNI